MLYASFDAGRAREAAISGAYQYDTGQRIRLHGLPSPAQLAMEDDFLSGDTVAVQAQFAYVGDSQSEPRLAVYDEESGCYLAAVPDSYLTHAKTVQVYVYVMYGADAEHSRSKTMYHGSFTPIARSAPGTSVTPDQLNAWDSLVAEVNLSLSRVNSAVSGANAAAAGANEAAERAEAGAAAATQAATAAQAMTDKWQKATASVTTLEPGTNATVALSESGGAKKLSFGIPRGEKGEKGDTGPAGVTFHLEGATLYIDTD